MLIASLVLLTLILMASVFHKINVPVVILSLAIGIIFGSDVTGIIYFDDAILAKQLANIALMFILFIGGFGTKKQNLRQVLKPVALLASVGILMTAAITGLSFSLITGYSIMGSMLIGSILSSTDAAAVFSILKNKAVEHKVKTLTEMESAANDPMAIVLTMFILSLMTGTQISAIHSIMQFIWLLSGGAGIGLLIGWLAVFVFNKIRNNEPEFFYVYLIAIVLLSYSIADLCGASGMLSTFFTGFLMGNKKIPYKKGVASFNNTLSFITNIGLFILLGLLVFPRKFSLIWDKGVIVFLIITLLSRPFTVFLLTLFSRINFKEKIFVSLAGVRGAVPIVLATYPAAMGLDHNHEIFNIVFFTVTLSMLIQGNLIVTVARKLKLVSEHGNRAAKILELVTVRDTNYEIIEVYIDEEIYEGSCRISDLKLPPGTLVTIIHRDDKIIAPSGSTEIRPKDTLTVLVDKMNIEMIPIEILRSFIIKKIKNQHEENTLPV